MSGTSNALTPRSSARSRRSYARLARRRRAWSTLRPARGSTALVGGLSATRCSGGSATTSTSRPTLTRTSTLGVLAGWAETTWETGRESDDRGHAPGAAAGDHDVPGRVVRRREPQSGRALRQHAARRPAPADFAVNAMAVSVPDLVFTDPYGGLDDLARRVFGPGYPGGVVRRRPPAHAARGPVPRPGSASRSRPRCGPDGPDGPRPRPHHRGAGPGRAHEAVCAADPIPGCGCSSTPAWPTCFCRSCRACAWPSTSLAQHKDALRAHPQWCATGSRSRRTAPTSPPAGFAAARTSASRSTGRRTRRPRQFPPSRGGGRASFTRQRLRALPLPEGGGRRRGRAGSAALCAAATDSSQAKWTDSAVRRYVTDAARSCSDCTT